MRIDRYPDMARAIKGNESELARYLNIEYRELWAIRKGKRHASPEVCLRLAVLLDIPPPEVMAAAYVDHSKNQRSREFWTGFIGHHSAPAFAVMLLIPLGFCGSVDTAHAGVTASNTGSHQTAELDVTGHYAKWARRARQLFLARFHHWTAIRRRNPPCREALLSRGLA